jgi:hypothetical protein
MHDAVHSAFTNTNELGHFAEANVGVFGDADEDMAVVGQERPFRGFFDHKFMIYKS